LYLGLSGPFSSGEKKQREREEILIKKDNFFCSMVCLKGGKHWRLSGVERVPCFGVLGRSSLPLLTAQLDALILLVRRVRFSLTLALGIRCPQRKVVPQELHYKGAVFVGIFIESIQFRNSIIKSLFG